MPRRLTTETFIQKAIEKHGDTFDYSKVVYIKSSTKIIIICKTHGEFLQRPGGHLYGDKCVKCKQQKFIDKYAQQATTETFIEKSIRKHGEKYEYSRVDYKNCDTPVEIICQTHGSFLQVPENHVQGNGCPKCNASYRLTLGDFITRSKAIHGDMYNYFKVVWKNITTSVLITCKKHGDFFQKPDGHLQGKGCTKCVNTGIFSREACSWLNYMAVKDNVSIRHALNHVDGEYRVMVGSKRYQVDGFCSDTNTVYEYHGSFWHGNPKIYKPDEINTIVHKTMGELYDTTVKKENALREAGYNVVTMWDKEWRAVIKTVKALQRKYRKNRKG